MSQETANNIKHAEIVEDNKLELPIDLVGEHVKSGRKILADYDQATGAIEVRPAHIGLTDVIVAKVKEIQEWNEKQGESLNPKPVDPEVVREELKDATEELEKEAVELEEVLPDDPLQKAIKESKVDPVILALLAQQAKTLEALTKKDEDDEDKRVSRQKGVVAEGKREIKKAAASILDDINHAENTEGCPMPPKKNPQFGDKTPAYVDWLKANRVEKYEKLFGVVERSKTMTIVKNGRAATVTADVAIRKNHLTQKPEMAGEIGVDQDWNA